MMSVDLSMTITAAVPRPDLRAAKLSKSMQQSMICTATITIEDGQWSNLVVAHTWSTNGPRIDASDRVYYTGIL